MLMLYANALCAVDRHADAVKAYERASAGARPLPEIHYLLGVARMSAGDFSGAVDAFDLHLKKSPDVEVYVLSSLCLDVEDERARSKTYFEAAMRKDSARAMEYLKEYAAELVAAGAEGEEAEVMKQGLEQAIGHIDEYLKERVPKAEKS
jgi:tetratricopeptide (TPR) repeat protein